MEEIYKRRQAALERYRLQYVAEHGDMPMITSESEAEDEID